MVYRKTIGKRMAAKLKDIRQQLRRRLHEAAGNTVKWLQSMVRGYFQYHAVPHNERRLKAFRHEVLRMWLRQLRRRSQRHRWTWNRFLEKLGNLLPDVEIPHPYPEARFAFNHPNFGRTSEVRTVCVRSASTDLCGGRRVTGIPTATAGPPVRLLEQPGANCLSGFCRRYLRQELRLPFFLLRGSTRAARPMPKTVRCRARWCLVARHRYSKSA